jgi:peptidoglycan/LPS O-acetylase OafA/YrhL
VGEAKVQAISAPLSPASATVDFVWPVATLIASVLGGMAGALVKRMQRGRVRSMRALRPVLIVGVLSGIVVVALYAVGVNVLPIQPTATAGEALTFVLAAVGAYLGLRIRESAAK